MVVIQEIKTVRYSDDEKHKTLLICTPKVTDLRQIRDNLYEDVRFSTNESTLRPNIVYAMQREGQRFWSRVTVKFFRKSDGVPVLQKLDETCTIDFNEQTIIVRTIQRLDLQNYEVKIFKMFVYGCYLYHRVHQAKHILSVLAKSANITAIYDIIAIKENPVHECYAGDLIFEQNGVFRSFREILIGITYPALVNDPFNQRILNSRSEFMSKHNVVSNLTKLKSYDLMDVIREGSVSFSMKY